MVLWVVLCLVVGLLERGGLGGIWVQDEKGWWEVSQRGESPWKMVPSLQSLSFMTPERDHSDYRSFFRYLRMPPMGKH